MLNVDFPCPAAHAARGPSQYLPKGQDLKPHLKATTVISIEWMRMLLNPDFWDHYITRYGEQSLVPEAPLAAREALFRNDGTLNDRNTLCLPEVIFKPPYQERPGMSAEERIAMQISNTRRDMHIRARQRLYHVGRTNVALVAGAGKQPHQEPGELQEPGAPQSQETEQIQEPIELPQWQGSPFLGPRQDPRPPTPTSPYKLPGEPLPTLSANEIHVANKIITYIYHFRNPLGLHVIATCTDDALWFHLVLMVLEKGWEYFTLEEFRYFLKACNLAGDMLRYVLCPWAQRDRTRRLHPRG